MTTSDIPVTPGVRVLREKGIPFRPFLYRYEDHGGTSRAAAELSVDEHAVVKTLIMEGDDRKALIVLMHGDREVSTKQLARVTGAKRIVPVDPQTALRLTGYQVGGISPFGTRTRLPVYVESGIFELPEIYLNGGKRGFLVGIAPGDLHKVFPVTPVEVAILPGNP